MSDPVSNASTAPRVSLPKYGEYYVAVVQSLRAHGGDATNEQMGKAVAELLMLSDTALAIPQPGDSRSKYQYQLAWARSHLHSKGIIENIGRGHWRLAEAAKSITDSELRLLDTKPELQGATIPEQGLGPKFKVERGVIAFANPTTAPKGDWARLRGLHPVLLQSASALATSLMENSGLWPHLESAANRYLSLVDVPLSSLDIPRLFGEGVLLSSALQEARRQERAGNSFPVADQPALLADSLLQIHGAFLMLSEDGRALAIGASHFQSSMRTRPVASAEEALVEALVAPASPVQTDVKEHLSELARTQAGPDVSNHVPSYKSAAIRNIAIAITGAAVLTTLAAVGGAIGLGLGAAAIALVGNETLKKTAAFKGSTDYLAGLTDGALARFFRAHKEEIRAVADPSQTDLAQALDWLDPIGKDSTSRSTKVRTALLLEPDIIQAQQIADQLSALGITTVGLARGYSEAITMAHRLKPEFLFTETVLVDGSGIEAVTEITKTLPVRVVFITSYPERLLGVDTRPEPAFLITKPFSHQMLADAVTSARFTRPLRT